MMKLKSIGIIAILAIIVTVFVSCAPPDGDTTDPDNNNNNNQNVIANFLGGEVQQGEGDEGNPRFNLQIKANNNNARNARFAGRSARSIAGLDLPTAGAEYPLSGDIFIPADLLPDGAEGLMLPMEGFYDDASGKFLASAATEDLRYTVSGIFDASGQLVGDPIVSVAEKDGETWIPEVFLSEIKEPDVHEIEPLDPETGGLPGNYQGRWMSSYSFSLSSAVQGEQNELHMIASAWYINMEHRHINTQGELTLVHEPWTIVSAEPGNGGYDIILTAPDYNNVSDDVKKTAEEAFYQEKGIVFAPLGSRTIAEALASNEPFVDGQGNWYNHWEAWSEYCFSGGLEKYIIAHPEIVPGNKYMKINLSLSSGGTLTWKSYSLLGLEGRTVWGHDNVFATLEEAEAINSFGKGMHGDGSEIPGLGVEEFQKRFYRTMPSKVASPAISPTEYSLNTPENTEITLTSETAGAELYYVMGGLSFEDIFDLESWTRYTSPFELKYNGSEFIGIDVLSMKDGMYSMLDNFSYQRTVGQRYEVTLNNNGIGHTDPGVNNFTVEVNLEWSYDEDMNVTYLLAPGEITLRYISTDSKATANFNIAITETEGGAPISHTGNNVDGFVFTMPAKPITITASGDFEYSGYIVTTIGNVEVDSFERVEAGDTVYLNVSEDAESITVKNDTTGDDITVEGPFPGNMPGQEKYTFTMPASNVTVEVVSGGPQPISVSIEEDIPESGDIQGYSHQAEEGETVGFFVVEDKGSTLASVKVTKTGDTSIVIPHTDLGDGQYSFTMPGYPVTIYAVFEGGVVYYDIDTSSLMGGSISSDKPSAPEGETVTLTVDSGSKIKDGTLKITKAGDPGTVIEYSGNLTDGYTFTMPAYDVTVYAEFEEQYRIDTNTNVGEGGMITSSPMFDCAAGETVTLSVLDKVKEGSFKVTKADDSTVEVTLSDPLETFLGYEYTFTMPAFDVTVYAEFEEEYEIDAFSNVTGGTVSVSLSSYAGETVTLTVPLSSELKEGTLKVTNANDETDVIELTGPVEEWDGYKYTFTMPAFDVKIFAEFEMEEM